MPKSLLDVASVALAMLPVIGMLYHRLRREPNFALSVAFLAAREVLRWHRRLVTSPPWDFPDHRPDESREETRHPERDHEE